MSLQGKLGELEKARDNSLQNNHPEKYSIILQESILEALLSVNASVRSLESQISMMLSEQGVGVKKEEVPAKGLKMPHRGIPIDAIIDDGGISGIPINDQFIPETRSTRKNG